MSAGVRLQILRAGIGAIVGTAFTLALCTLGESSRTAVTEQLLGGGELIRVKQIEGVSAFGLEVNSLIPGNKGSLFTSEDMTELEGMDGIAKVWPEAWSRFPVYIDAKAPLVGKPINGDGVLLGVPYEAVARDLPGYTEEDPDGGVDAWQWEPGQTVPIALPRSVMVAYNSGYAPANGWPKISDDAVIGFKMDLCPGASIYDKARTRAKKCKDTKVEAEIVAVTPYAGELAAIVPLEFVKWAGEQQELDRPGDYTSMLLTLKTGADPDEIKEEIKNLGGWRTEDVGGAARNLSIALRAIDLGVALAGAVIVFAALILLAQVYGVLLRERRNDIRVLRALGSSRISLGLALLLEVGLASLSAAATGVVIGVSIAYFAGQTVAFHLTAVLGTAVEVSPAPPGWLMWGMIIGTPLVAMVSVIVPIMQALRSR
jgi:hypothetical protein